MSETLTAIGGPAATPVATGINWLTVGKDVSIVVTALAPFASIMVPGAGAAISIGAKVLAAMVAGEPAAAALFTQIVNGTPPSADQLAQYVSNDNADSLKAHADIKAAIARLAPAA